MTEDASRHRSLGSRCGPLRWTARDSATRSGYGRCTLPSGFVILSWSALPPWRQAAPFSQTRARPRNAFDGERAAKFPRRPASRARDWQVQAGRIHWWNSVL